MSDSSEPDQDDGDDDDNDKGLLSSDENEHRRNGGDEDNRLQRIQHMPETAIVFAFCCTFADILHLPRVSIHVPDVLFVVTLASNASMGQELENAFASKRPSVLLERIVTTMLRELITRPL